MEGMYVPDYTMQLFYRYLNQKVKSLKNPIVIMDRFCGIIYLLTSEL